MAPRRKQEHEDLTLVEDATEEAIQLRLKERWSRDDIYTRIGDDVLVSVNPFKMVASSSEEQCKAFAKWAKNSSDDKESLPPHVFDLAASAYFHMMRDGKDQSLVLIGEGGSGKSYLQDLFVRQLCALSKKEKKKSKIQSGVEKFDQILAAFGNASTPISANSSRFGKYTEYQFDASGKMIGAKVLDYMLEKTRVTSSPNTERNFHIFYYLLAGTTPEEKEQLHLHDAAHFKYLHSGKGPRPNTSEDSVKFSELRQLMKSIGIGRRQQGQIYQLIAALLHLGNLEFQDDPENENEACRVKNYETLTLVAEFLSIDPQILEAALTYRTKLIKKELCTVLLNAEGAAAQRDAMAQTLYALLFSWIVEHVNIRLCQDDCANFIGLVDFGGFQDTNSHNSFYTLLRNFMHEKVYDFANQHLFVNPGALFEADNVAVPDLAYLDNRELIDLIAVGKENANQQSILSILDIECGKGRTKNPDGKMTEAITEAFQLHSKFIMAEDKRSAFGIKHYAQSVTYPTKGFIEQNLDVLSVDFISLFKGSGTSKGTSSVFIRGLFSEKAISTKRSETKGPVISVQQAHKPLRQPSIKRKKRDEPETNTTKQPLVIETLASQLADSLEEMFETLNETRPWFVYCIRPNDHQEGGKWDSEKVLQQIRALGLEQITRCSKLLPYTSIYSIEQFLDTYGEVINPVVEDDSDASDPKTKVKKFIEIAGFTDGDILLGSNNVYTSELTFRGLNEEIRGMEKARAEAARQAREATTTGLSVTVPKSPMKSPKRSSVKSPFAVANAGASSPLAKSPLPPGSPNGNGYDDDAMSYYSEQDYYDETGSYYDDNASYYDDNESHYDSEYDYDNRRASQSTLNPLNEIEMGKMGQEQPKKKEMSRLRVQWLCCTWCLTWWIPSCCLSMCGRMKRKDIQIAWREKLALFMIIIFLSLVMLFFIVGLTRIICPPQKVKTLSEIQSDWQSRGKMRVAAYGRYYDVKEIVDYHLSYYVPLQETFLDTQFSVLGQDVSFMFSKVGDNFERYCPGVTNPNSATTQSSTTDSSDNSNRTQPPAVFDNIFPRNNDEKTRYLHSDPEKSYLRYMNQYAAGRVAWPIQEVKNKVKQQRKFVVIYDNVYDFTTYSAAETKFLWPELEVIINAKAGQEDATDMFNKNIREKYGDWRTQFDCMNEMFYVGTVDRRNEWQCILADTILVFSSAVICLAIIVKFIAAILHFGNGQEPEDNDKFVICQVPCYTEGPESLTKTLESLAMLRYDDKRKLLFVISDGMIIGSGNDRPTPRIVLDILGVDPSVDPQPLSFHSLGEGNGQLNMGKVYSGLYEVQGHDVPFIVVVKVGKPTERSRPGNRGKRDSQMILMNFLNKVHFNQEMSPLELELYHHMKNVIGVNPSFYEYAFMVDADTEVAPHSLNSMISCMVHDSKIMGICGETLLSNEKESFVTMIQVYEYFISHHLAKAFESLFGSVTCLPGCFCMYRIRTPTKNTPLLVAPQIIGDYSDNDVDTLHKKNLLSLGEDRYLTTLMMKHFPQMKLSFTADAQCRTNAPERFKVLKSQRRRWINSTVHNLLELLALPQLCGFCFFSMRFVVFLDLISTIVQPASILYIVYLIYSVIADSGAIPMISLIMIAGIYGLQIIILLLKGQWQHIIWMLIYIAAMPIFGFYIPLYSFWHFDDFSWGNTRQVADGKKGTKYVVDAEPFDPRSVPMKKWSDHEQDIWERHSVASSQMTAGNQYGNGINNDYGSEMTGVTYTSRYSAMVMPVAPAPAAGNRMSMAFDGGRRPSLEGSVYGGEAQNRRSSAMYGGSVYGGSVYGGGYVQSGGLPIDLGNGVVTTEDELIHEIRRILSVSDLMTITKKQVRDSLSEQYGVDVSSQKETINRTIDAILAGQL